MNCGAHGFIEIKSRIIQRSCQLLALAAGLRSKYEMLGRTGLGFIILILIINIPALWNAFSASFYAVGDFLLHNLIIF